MKGLSSALRFLTVLPVKGGEGPQPGDLGRAAGWFGWVGLIVGLAAGGAWWLSGLILAAILSVATWAAVTGGLHLDGLADCCDGFFNASSPAHRLEIMKDPRLGTFGAIGIFIFLALKIGAVLSLPPHKAFLAICLAACTGRWMILLASRQPAARPGGLGADFKAGIQPQAYILSAIPTAVLGISLGWNGLLAVGAALLAALGIFRLARRKIGGFTGDVLGLIVEASEVVGLLACGIHL
jgi:adenosylcobinamide-GDP ribazoletransferase